MTYRNSLTALAATVLLATTWGMEVSLTDNLVSDSPSSLPVTPSQTFSREKTIEKWSTEGLVTPANRHGVAELLDTISSTVNLANLVTSVSKLKSLGLVTALNTEFLVYSLLLIPSDEQKDVISELESLKKVGFITSENAWYFVHSLAMLPAEKRSNIVETVKTVMSQMPETRCSVPIGKLVIFFEQLKNTSGDLREKIISGFLEYGPA